MNLLKTGRPSKNKEIALKNIEDQEPKVRINVNVTKTMHKSVKTFALEQDITISELIVKALDEYMKK